MTATGAGIAGVGAATTQHTPLGAERSPSGGLRKSLHLVYMRSTDGTVAHRIEVEALISNDIRVEIINDSTGDSLAASSFKWRGMGDGWQLAPSIAADFSASFSGYRAIPSTTSPNDFALATWSSYISTLEIKAKLDQLQSRSTASPRNAGSWETYGGGSDNIPDDSGYVKRRSSGPPETKEYVPKCRTQCTLDQIADAKNISDAHDMRCTYSPDEWGLWLPCVGGFTVNIKSCCENHDIDLWCGPTSSDPSYLHGWVTEMNLKLAACIYAKILKGTLDQDVPWYCGGKITALAFGMAYAAVVSMGYLLGVTILTFIQLADPHSKALPLDGRNKDSCLCGGTKPTVANITDNPHDAFAGSTPCRDLCQEKGKAEDCYDCHWSCELRDGKLVSVWTTDPDEKQLCCPGSARQCSCNCDAPSCAGGK